MVLAGYSGTPLPKKLGIKPGTQVGLVNAPAGVAETIGALPDGASLKKMGRAKFDLLLWFVSCAKELTTGIGKIAGRLSDQSVWILWPKKTSGVATDASEPLVRATGLAAGLVDYKVCAFDATWSGLKFTRRKKPV